MKTYRKDGNNKTKGKTYCKEHFIEKYGREPNILDTAHLLRSCDSIDHCEYRNGLGRICDGLLKPVSYTHLTLPTNREV